MDGNHWDAGKRGFVFEKGPQLSESPFSKRLPLSLANRRLESLQVFKGNAPLCLQGNRNNAFGNFMIYMFLESSFLAGEFFQMIFCRFRTTLLKLSLKFSRSFSDTINSFSGERISIRGDGKIDNAKIHADKLLHIFNIFFGHFDSLKEIKFSFLCYKVSLASNIRKIFRIVADKRHSQSAINRPDGNKIFSISKNAGVISDCAEYFKSSLNLPIKFIGISNLGNAAHNDLSRKFKLFFNAIIDKMMNFILIKNLIFPGNAGNFIASFIAFPDSFQKRISLLDIRKKLDLKYQFHGYIVNQILENVKRLLLPALKDGVSEARRIL